MLTKVVILTRFHSITGETDLGTQRLSDTLNDDRQSAIRLANTQVARLSNPTKLIAQQNSAVVPKHQIVVAFEPQPPPTTPRHIYSYIKKSQHGIFLTTDGIEVRGFMHTTETSEIADIYHFLVMRKEPFMPLTQAVITFCDDDRLLIKQNAIMVNVQRIHYIGKSPMPQNLTAAKKTEP